MLCTTAVSAELRARLTEGGGLAERIQLLRRLINVRLVGGRNERRLVEALRYRAFAGEGAVEARADMRLGDAYDLSPNARTFGLWFGDQLLASIRLHLVADECDESPALAVFGDELRPFVRAGERLIDPNCFCVDPQVSGVVPELAYLTLRLPFAAAEMQRHVLVTATARAEHHAFYRRVMRAVPIASPRPYPGRTKPLGLMLVDYAQERDAILARYPFFMPALGEMAELGLERASSKADAVPA